jgi:hypothetical protein
MNFSTSDKLKRPFPETYFLEATLARSARASRRLNLASWITPTCVSLTKLQGWSLPLTSIGIAAEVARPCDEGLVLVCAGCDGVYADGGHDGRVGELGLGGDDGVCDEVVDRLHLSVSMWHNDGMAASLTECSSCLTSSSVPSLKVHLTISVSSEVPLTNSLLSSLDQNLLKSWSLIRCQTSLKDASMTADSLTEVDVGMLPDMLVRVVQLGGG